MLKTLRKKFMRLRYGFNVGDNVSKDMPYYSMPPEYGTVIDIRSGNRNSILVRWQSWWMTGKPKDVWENPKEISRSNFRKNPYADLPRR